MDTVSQTLKRYWGFDTLREKQVPIVDAVLANKDVLAVLATGGGKSLCYQLPALIKEGTCLVISPLMALMEDQVAQLKSRGVAAAFVHSGMPYRDQDRILQEAMDGLLDLLYVSPERIKSKMFDARVAQINISFIAVDEAHCISQWGHDFRPSYRNISDLRSQLKVPILAVTATATPNVQDDIIENLGLEKPVQLISSPKRENLSYQVIQTEDKLGFLKAFILKHKTETGLIYVRSRRLTKEIAAMIGKFLPEVASYHAGLDQKEKEHIQESWVRNELRLIVATNAFGMGIDKSDVRYVLHYEMPPSLEEYIQEAGRAGRDGQAAQAILLFSPYDKAKKLREIKNSFPNKDFIRKVYYHLCRKYHIPPGEGVGERFRFDLAAFTEENSFPALQTFHALKIIHQANYIFLSDKLFHPSRMKVDYDIFKSLLREGTLPKELEEYMRGLLRIYEGLYYDFVKISETEIESKLQIPRKAHAPILSALEKRYLIKYIKAHQSAYIRFTLKRPDNDILYLPSSIYEKRLERALGAVEAVFKYIAFEDCRQGYIESYFGFPSDTLCGECDYCQNENEQDALDHQVLSLLRNGTVRFSNLRVHFKNKEWPSVMDLLYKWNENGRIDIAGDTLTLNE